MTFMEDLALFRGINGVVMKPHLDVFGVEISFKSYPQKLSTGQGNEVLMKRHAALTSTFSNGFDSHGTLTAQSLSKAHRDPLRRVGRGVLVAIGISLFTPAYADAPDMAKQLTIKEYAAVLVDDKTQMSCLGKLYGKESAWRHDAVNGSHYGIPQGRSIYLKTALPEQQIMWGLKYIDNRYGSPCKAWDFFKKNNYH
jgi:hypothetical protein